LFLREENSGVILPSGVSPMSISRLYRGPLMLRRSIVQLVPIGQADNLTHITSAIWIGTTTFMQDMHPTKNRDKKRDRMHRCLTNTPDTYAQF